jgi:hypothetical protein
MESRQKVRKRDRIRSIFTKGLPNESALSEPAPSEDNHESSPTVDGAMQAQPESARSAAPLQDNRESPHAVVNDKGDRQTQAESARFAPAPSQKTQESPHAVAGDHGDRQRTEERYCEAASLLEKAVKGRRDHGDSESFNFPELSGEPEKFDDAQFREKVNAALEARKAAIENPTGWSKCKDTVQCIYQASSPFAKNFLAIASSAQSVVPSSFSNSKDPSSKSIRSHL